MKTISVILVSFLVTGCANTPLTSTSWLASAAIAAVVSAIISLIAGVILKGKEYKNDYFKKVIDKRIKAIEALEACISLFSSYYESTEGQVLYHTILVDDTGAEVFNEAVDEVKKYGIWYSPATAINIRKFSNFASSTLMDCRDESANGKEKIALRVFIYLEHNRAVLEECIRNDMASLHKVKEFFKSMAKVKKHDSSSNTPPSL
jgi:hypothetical protein